MEESVHFAADLEQAAVAGAEGTAWGISDFSVSIPLNGTSYSSFPFEYPKQEPSFLDIAPIPPPQSPPLQTSSLSSVESDEMFTRKRSLPGSPMSPIAKRRAMEDLGDLKGTTAARSRKMTEEERRVMLHKRRLRNRASAARSREKRSRTLNDLTNEVEELMKRAQLLAEQSRKFIEENNMLKAKNAMLTKENELLKAELKI